MGSIYFAVSDVSKIGGVLRAICTKMKLSIGSIFYKYKLISREKSVHRISSEITLAVFSYFGYGRGSFGGMTGDFGGGSWGERRL